MKTPNKNAKNPDWNVPVHLPAVTPEDYFKDSDTPHGSPVKNADKQKPDSGPPDYTLPGHPSPDDSRKRRIYGK